MDATACGSGADKKAKLQQKKPAGADLPRGIRSGDTRPAPAHVQHASTARTSAGARRTTGKKSSQLWDRDQAVQLSRLVLGFARSSRRLPDAGDRAFWQLCYKRFHGTFTGKQVQSKVRYLHLRFHRLASGAAKTLHLQERLSVQIWTHIMQHISPLTSTNSSSRRVVHRNRSTYSSAPACSSRSRSHDESYDPTSYEHVSAAGRAHDPAGYTNDSFTDRQAAQKGTTGTRYPNLGGAAAAADDAGLPAQEAASACSTQEYMEEDDMGNMEDFDDYEGHEGMNGGAGAAGVGAGPGQYCGAGGAAQAAHSFDDDRAALLYHTTLADLASAVKTLAEAVAHRQRPRC